MTGEWIKHDGYNEKHQYIANNGRICGEVQGSTFNKDSGWIALDETKLPSRNLGRYTTLEAAKAVVEKTLLRIKA